MVTPNSKVFKRDIVTSKKFKPIQIKNVHFNFTHFTERPFNLNDKFSSSGPKKSLSPAQKLNPSHEDSTSYFTCFYMCNCPQKDMSDWNIFDGTNLKSLTRWLQTNLRVTCKTPRQSRAFNISLRFVAWFKDCRLTGTLVQANLKVHSHWTKATTPFPISFFWLSSRLWSIDCWSS